MIVMMLLIIIEKSFIVLSLLGRYLGFKLISKSNPRHALIGLICYKITTETFLTPSYPPYRGGSNSGHRCPSCTAQVTSGNGRPIKGSLIFHIYIHLIRID